MEKTKQYRQFNVKEIEKTCSCGSRTQWDGETSKGEILKIRYNWGYLSISVSGGNVFVFMTDEERSIMDFEEMKELTKPCLNFDNAEHTIGKYGTNGKFNR